LLWTGRTNLRVQQCPSYDGKSATLGDPFTGYNYNTSYIGRGQGEAIEVPAKVTQVRRPCETALFGDAGATQLGTNKFMRSPLRSPSEKPALSDDARINGAQGFRHNNNRASNVAFCDGHAESRWDRLTGGLAVEAHTGFLSNDNTLYDLE
jgi:prepilin-type processing-associated H-X9-DG protein